jgi:hypothetical protein
MSDRTPLETLAERWRKWSWKVMLHVTSGKPSALWIDCDSIDYPSGFYAVTVREPGDEQAYIDFKEGVGVDAESVCLALTEFPKLVAEVSSLESQLKQAQKELVNSKLQTKDFAEQALSWHERAKSAESRLQAVTEALIKVRTWIESDPCDVREPLEWIDEALAESTERIAESRPSAEEVLAGFRADGWMVAVHNDYRVNGEAFTFWLLTKGDRCAKGEGRTDLEALNAIRMQERITRP